MVTLYLQGVCLDIMCRGPRSDANVFKLVRRYARYAFVFFLVYLEAPRVPRQNLVHNTIADDDGVKASTFRTKKPTDPVYPRRGR